MDANHGALEGGDAGFRSVVAATAVRLFEQQGFEATSVEDIARAAGISRSTFFRQFRSKEDVVFADHDELIDQAEKSLAGAVGDPWKAVCEAAAMVFRHYSRQSVMARQRYRVVNSVPALRDKELVSVFRYEQLFNQHLRRALPGMAPLEGIRFSSAVVSTNNYFLRTLMRDANPPTEEDLLSALDDVRRLHGVLHGGQAAEDEVVVAIFPRSISVTAMAQRVGAALAESGLPRHET
jgi:AcrR family transcriptional regulator